MTTVTKTLWKIDPTHSEVQLKVKQLVISTVTEAESLLVTDINKLQLNMQFI